VGFGLVVVGDEAAVPGAGELVVLAFERVEDALDPLAHRAQRHGSGGLVAAIGTDQPGAVACDELLECLPGVALVGEDDVAGGRNPFEDLGGGVRSSTLAATSSKPIGIPSGAQTSKSLKPQ
jgi:hypothetical protein